MQAKKPIPPTTQDNKPRRMCPVCGKASYSLGGIHPQCSQTREDAPRIKALNAAKKTKKPKLQVARLPSLWGTRRAALP